MASFISPQGLIIDGDGNLIVADTDNHVIKKVYPSGLVTTIAGNGTMGANDGQGESASFKFPKGITLDNLGNLYVADSGNNRIRKVDDKLMVTTIAGNGAAGSIDGEGATATFRLPEGILFNPAGFLYVVDTGENKIRKIDLS